MPLATTLWPRTGGDVRNCACIPVEGPTSGRILWSLDLPSLCADRCYRGAILAADGHLRVVHRGTLSAVTLAGRKLWTRSLKLRKHEVGPYSLPLALADGRVLFTANRHLAEECGGRLKVLASRFLADDSGPSPNVSGDHVYLGGIERLQRWDGASVAGVGPETGYDLLPPAIFSNGDLGVACYYGDGLCRLKPNGATVWSRPPLEVDGLVVINNTDEIACSSLNDRCSVVMDGGGNELWRHPVAARFSCHHDGGWVALSAGRIARLDRYGRTLWAVPAEVDLDWGLLQAVVDARGWVYAPTRRGLASWDADGKLRFIGTLASGRASSLCPVAPGRMALVHDGRLLLLE